MSRSGRALSCARRPAAAESATASTMKMCLPARAISSTMQRFMGLRATQCGAAFVHARQEVLAGAVDKGNVHQIDGQVAARRGGHRSSPGLLQFTHPWSGELALQLERAGLRRFLNGDAQHDAKRCIRAAKSNRFVFNGMRAVPIAAGADGTARADISARGWPGFAIMLWVFRPFALLFGDGRNYNRIAPNQRRAHVAIVSFAVPFRAPGDHHGQSGDRLPKAQRCGSS